MENGRDNRAAESLIEREARLSAIVDSAADAIIMLDRKQRMVLFNPAAERLFGYTAEEISGEAFDRLLPPRFRTGQPDHRDLLLQATPTHRPPGAVENITAQRADGEEFLIEASISCVDIDGNRYSTLILRDITERASWEAQLKASRAQIGELKSALDEHLMVAVTDPEGKIVYANDKFCSISKYSREEFLGQDHRIFNSGHHSAEFFQDLWTTITKGKVWRNEIKNRAKDGSFYWADTTILPFLDDGGKPRQYVVIRTDVTQSRLTQERLHNSEAQFHAYIEQAGDPIFVYDFSGRFIEVNQQACYSLGYTREELLQMGVADLRTGFDLSEAQTRWSQLVPNVPVTTVSTHRRKDGSTFPVEIRLGCFDVEGYRRYLGIVRDITERRTHERELERINRLYGALSQINHAIVRMPTRDELFQHVCRILVETAGFRMAWIGWPDPESHRLLPVAAFGDENGYLQSITIYTDERPEGRGPSGTAFREERTYVSNDLLGDPAAMPWRTEASIRNFQSSATFVVRLDGKVSGTLAVYGGDSGLFQDREIALLEEAAGDISFALDNLAREEKRRQAEAASVVSKK